MNPIDRLEGIKTIFRRILLSESETTSLSVPVNRIDHVVADKNAPTPSIVRVRGYGELAQQAEAFANDLIKSQLASMSLEELQDLKRRSKTLPDGQQVVEMSWILDRYGIPRFVDPAKEQQQEKADYERLLGFFSSMAEEQDEHANRLREMHEQHDREFCAAIAEIESLRVGSPR